MNTVNELKYSGMCYWICIMSGIITGILFCRLKKNRFGLFDNILVGVVGGVLSGWAFGCLEWSGVFNIGYTVASVVGAFLVLWGLSWLDVL
ncbi:GlsB/YeaQ/YmgE family stress response membrane protein [Phocaeicola sp.]|uniref:GlsB/YeaQ/YmgE family stress response membrane protein n=1 Tax=Phocaeicola sp. TaxID=2773926 RepID=UPI0023BE0602|nr:GlsB/YeaQ/YmgE family stress response membrane protein [Phocaeicola sp.]MDE5676472.1 GlsB/YeaQ/YmgE family stress response membrane protein [Phocaeicola sp.]